MFVSSSFYFHMLYWGWVDYLIIKIPVSTWELYDLKIEAKNQHNKIKFSTNRRGVTASAVFLVWAWPCFHCGVFRDPKNGTLKTNKPPAMQVSQHCFSLQ